MTIHNFQQLTAKGVKKMKCFDCGKRYTRQRTFSQTINPWNKNEDGTPKTAQEVMESVRAEATDWELNTPDPEHGCRQLTDLEK